MTKRIVAEIDKPIINNDSENSNKLNIEYNPEEGIAKFSLEDETLVEMKYPKTRQFLLLDSFMKSAEPEYRTESFAAVKLASLCITKFGVKDKVTFDELLDTLEISDLERVAAAINCFQNKIDVVGRKSLL